MRLACEGCDAVLHEETAEELAAAMMAHGREVHSNLWEGKTPDQAEELEQMMIAHVRQMIADQN